MNAKWWGYGILTVVILGVLGAEPLPEPPGKTDAEKITEFDRLLGEIQNLRNAGKIQEALNLCAKAAALDKEVEGENNAAMASLLKLQAEMQEELDDFASAHKIRAMVLTIRTQLHGETHWKTFDARRNLHDNEMIAGMTVEKRKQLRRAEVLNREFNRTYQQGRYGEALKIVQEALEIHRRILGDHHPDTATTLTNVAGIYFSQGDYTKAESLFSQSLEIRRQALCDGHPEIANSLTNLGTMYLARGDTVKAMCFLKQGLETQRLALGYADDATANSLNSLGALYSEQGDYRNAEPLCKQALEIARQAYGERNPLTVSCLNNLGHVYIGLGEYAKAEPLLKQALEVNRETFGDSHPKTMQILNNLGTVYMGQRMYAKAEPNYKQLLEIRRKTLGESHPDTIQAYTCLAMLYVSKRDHAKAQPFYRAALEALSASTVSNNQQNNPDISHLRALPRTMMALVCYGLSLRVCLHDKSTVEQIRSVEQVYQIALKLREDLRHEVSPDRRYTVDDEYLTNEVICGRIGLLHRLFKAEGKTADLEAAFTTAEQGVGLALLEQLDKARAAKSGVAAPDLLREESALNAQLNSLGVQIDQEQSKLKEKQNPITSGKLFDLQNQLEQQLAKLVIRMEQESPQYAALKYPHACSLSEARDCLGKKEVALLYTPGIDGSFVIVVEKTTAKEDKSNGITIVPLAKEDDFNDAISSLRDSETLGDMARVRTAGDAAYKLLLAPLKDKIKGKDLLILPGGPLCRLPFELLQEDGQFLIERHRIRYAPSLTALHFVRKWEKSRAQPTTPLWAVANPLYDASDLRFGLLPNSDEEVRAVADVLKAAPESCHTTSEASEAVVKKASADGSLARARYVHFACHGILDFEHCQQPTLVLSQVGTDDKEDADGGRNDGLLRLDEITRLKLNADLVVLSVSQTAQGQPNKSEGGTGVARAWMFAGCRGVLSSLWLADGAETEHFMTELYAGLQKGMRTADAVRAVKLKMIQEGKSPASWAPFILMGE